MKISSFPDNWIESKQKSTLFDRFARRSLLKFLQSLSHGHLRIHEDNKTLDFGDPGSDLKATIVIQNPSAYRMMLLGGSIGAGEAYISKCWSSPDLTSVIRIFSRNVNQFNKGMDSGFAALSLFMKKLKHKLMQNSLSGSRKNIHAHYDLSNDLFTTFLDPKMMYSSAVYGDTIQNLDEASVNKLKLIGEKLDLQPDHHVVEIGTGWGGLSIYLAQRYGCKITTTTISGEQYRYAVEQVRKHQLDHLITVLDKDYRELEGQFDRLVSVEMIEAVGYEYFPTFFKKCNALLKPGGRMVLQAITIPEQRYEYAKLSVDFIKRYIFPGGCLPSLEEIERCTDKHTDMKIQHVDDIGLDYAQTLQHWRERFFSSLEQVRQLGFDDLFIRLWEFYLCYCEGGFREKAINTVQATFHKKA